MTTKRAARTSDVARPRVLGVSAFGGALGATIVLALDGRPLTETRQIARAHVAVACASCHREPTETASKKVPEHLAASCVTCHGSGHSSTRAGHRALAAKGELSCATCHSQHERAQGITVAESGIVRWGAGASNPISRPKDLPGIDALATGTTVPLVSLAACAQCHSPSSASDPVSACVPAALRTRPSEALATVASGCFDEHVRLGESRASRGPSRDEREDCAKQHTANRFVAWEAARTIARKTDWVPARKDGHSPWSPAAGGLASALLFGAVGAALERRKARPTETPKALVPSARKRLPVIDPSTCLGCYACVDACPFDVLAIEKYVAVVARPEECCGVVTCEQVCPNGSLRVADGPVVSDQPQTDAHLESVDVPGMFLAGDLTGLPLIKNAIAQGVRAVDRIARTGAAGRGAAVDVLVIGAGPAGLSAALRAQEKGLSCVVVEQATVAASIKSFPRDKIVHDPPLDLPVLGELWLKESTKEELLGHWQRIVRARALDVREGHRVVDIRRTEDGFAIVAERAGGESVELRGARIVVAIGRRGTPRRLDLAIDSGIEDCVHYALADARSFAGKRVLVVGLGDAAMEAAVALARQPGTEVTVSYRGKGFGRGKKKNIDQVEALVREGRLRILFETVPTAVAKSGVTLASAVGTTGGGPGRPLHSVRADAVFVLIGGTPSWDLLTRAGLRRPG